LIQKEEKEKCVEFVLSKLDKHEIDIVTLYNEILTPALNNMEYKNDEAKISIWKEHVRSSIIRTIIECCYPYIFKERETKYKAAHISEKVVVLCPTEEYHEIGARMVTDFFTLLGFEVTFVGANTPLDDIIVGIQMIDPKYVGISVSNFYNLSAARRIVSRLLETRKANDLQFKIIVGGHAFKTNPNEYKEMGADLQLQTFLDLKNLGRGD
jgi:methanogenic corrinoid protein MtbC1